MAYTIAICFCNNLFGEGIKALLKEKELGIKKPINFSDPEKIAKTKLDLIIADFNSLSRIFNDTTIEHKVRILLLESECLPLIANERLFNFISKGLVGMISHKDNASQLNKAIKAIMSGELWFDRKRLDGGTDINPNTLATKSSLLTKRELEMVEMVSQGHSNKEIMKKLFISEQTVKSHLNGVYKKLGINDRLQLCIMATTTNQLKLHQLLQKQEKTKP